MTAEGGSDDLRGGGSWGGLGLERVGGGSELNDRGRGGCREVGLFLVRLSGESGRVAAGWRDSVLSDEPVEKKKEKGRRESAQS